MVDKSEIKGDVSHKLPALWQLDIRNHLSVAVVFNGASDLSESQEIKILGGRENPEVPIPFQNNASSHQGRRNPLERGAGIKGGLNICEERRRPSILIAILVPPYIVFGGLRRNGHCFLNAVRTSLQHENNIPGKNSTSHKFSFPDDACDRPLRPARRHDFLGMRHGKDLHIARSLKENLAVLAPGLESC